MPYLLEDLQPYQTVLADKAYSAGWVYDLIDEKGATVVIPTKSNAKVPREYDKELYKKRNCIERFFGRIKQSFKRIAMRSEKHANKFLAMVKLAAIKLWCQFYDSTA